MKKIGDNKLYNVMEQNGCNLLAYAYTPWHVHGVLAVVRYIETCGIEVKGVVCLCKHPQAGLILDESYFLSCKSSLSIFEYEPENGGYLHIINYIKKTILPSDLCGKKYFLIIPNRFEPMVHARFSEGMHSDNIESFVIDEGLATYMRSETDFYKEALEHSGNIIRKAWIRFRLGMIDSRYIKKISRVHLLNDFKLLMKTSDSLGVNDLSVPFYRKVIAEGGMNIPGEQLCMYEDSVIINTQPFWDEGTINNNEDVNILIEFCRKCAEQNLHLVIKPHPREKNLDRYDCLRDYAFIETRKNITQESIIAALDIKPLAIVGFSSTTLISAKIFYDIPTYSLVQLWDYDKIDPELSIEEQRFFHTFSSILPCFADIDELVDKIKKGDTCCGNIKCSSKG